MFLSNAPLSAVARRPRRSGPRHPCLIARPPRLRRSLSKIFEILLLIACGKTVVKLMLVLTPSFRRVDFFINNFIRRNLVLKNPTLCASKESNLRELSPCNTRKIILEKYRKKCTPRESL